MEMQQFILFSITVLCTVELHVTVDNTNTVRIAMEMQQCILLNIAAQQYSE